MDNQIETSERPPSQSLGQKLQSLPKSALYFLLLFLTSLPFLLMVFNIKMVVPNKPVDPTIDFYNAIMAIPEGSTIFVGSDWTNSTRGESGAHFTALVRIMMRRNIKVAFYTTADPQAPQVARDWITRLNEERRKEGQETWDRWDDWVSLGYFPNAEGTLQSFASDLRGIIAGRKESAPDGQQRDVLQSPVLQNVKSIRDIPLLVVITASKTSVITIGRLNGKVPMAFMVTGVMGPETLVYYQSGQLVGLAAGLKGAYDIETMMESGINNAGPDGKITVSSSKVQGSVPGFPGMKNQGNGALYYPALLFALTLLVLAVIVGNVGMMLARRQR